jgi:hypothetical protein
MPKIKYFAEHDGQTFTRNSDRVYTHMVIVRNRLTKKLAEAQEWADRAARWHDEETDADRRKSSAERAARAVAERTELENRIAAGEVFDAWGTSSWCGRPDLAMKAFNDAHKWHDEAKVLEAQTR